MQISERTNGKEKHVIFIPKEVVIEILRRIPCHDLSENLKMVCMQWCSIIYSGSFANSHFEQRILKSSSFSQLEAVVTSVAYDDGRSVRFSSLQWHNSYQNHQFQNWKIKNLYTVKDVWDHASPHREPMSMVRVNSVNGFVCFLSNADARFHISNPVTKEYVTTPTNTSLGLGLANAIGFGFCPLSYEYKVVVLSYTNSDEMEPTIFTVGIDQSWRSLKRIPHILCSLVETIAHVNGVLYWYSETCSTTDTHLTHKSKTKTLVCFDVSKEEFDMIELPIESLGERISIADKGGKLCLINISYCPSCSLLIEVHVANNLHDNLSRLSSWKKEFNVIAPSIAYDFELENLYVVIITDEILVIQLGGGDDDEEEALGFFDIATGKLLGVYFVPDYAAVIPYVPSLIAIHHRPPLAASSS